MRSAKAGAPGLVVFAGSTANTLEEPGCAESFKVCVPGEEKMFGFPEPKHAGKPDGVKVYKDGRCASAPTVQLRWRDTAGSNSLTQHQYARTLHHRAALLTCT
jgi:hypothetical protein